MFVRGSQKLVVLLLLAEFLILSVAAGQTPMGIPAGANAPAPAADWVKRSNANAQIVLDVIASFAPEGAGRLGVEGLDEEVTQYPPDFREQRRKRGEQVRAELRKRLAAEKDPLVKQDLEILVKAADDSKRGDELREKYDMDYFNLTQSVFQGIRSLLDDQVPAERRKAALVRLRKYAGVEPGFTPLTEQAMARTRERNRKPGLLGPAKAELEKDLGNASFFIGGIEQLFKKYQIAGYEEPYAKLKQQLEAYNDLLRKELLPKARTDFRLPPEQYAFALNQVGVDIAPAELAAMAHKAFDDIQAQMQKIAVQVAKERGWKMTDYRDVIRELKKDQIVGDAILPHYQDRLKQIEEIIRREKLVTLPARAARIRLASAAESAATPAPNMRPPRLLGNKGEMGEFVLPLNIPAAPGSKEATQKFDDFTYSAASWTLTAHEARPGHEMQFAAVIEKGVSTARAVFAFNSTNVEGWGLYSEAITLPYMPAEGQLVSLGGRLMRAARAFLDPELQTGKVTPEQAKAVLMNDVVLSDAMATQEVERYTFRAPGQATSYFYGYTRLMELRADTQKELGAAFDQQKFHDFILAEGLLPPDLVRKAVFEKFVPSQRAQMKAAVN